MYQHEDKENEDHFDEPSLEDFLPNEDDRILQEKQSERRAFIRKVIAIWLVFAMFISIIQIWPQIFNLSSIKFLQKSAELSEQENILKYKEAVVTIQDQYSKGTGFNISENGVIITNKHVVENMHPITITFPNGKIYKASIIQMDPEIDLAFLKIQGEKLPFLPLSAPDIWQVGDHIVVIGNPLLHNQIANEGEILEGSKKNGVIRLSSPIYKGNSGSPIINQAGQVIGVVYAISTNDQAGIAIPIEQVLEKLAQYENKQ
ncbi:trypsin-like peptidase domain-containing protein [Bacillus sp. Bva_UNVM-123]|uniref:S1C family serine protease n=1 Tax=Bacillus sp. Bva_UNVM-123 TaxID=2829798 RepID=UPI00391F9FBA